MKIYFHISGLIVVLNLILYTPVLAQKGTGDSIGVSRALLKPQIELIEGTLDSMKTGPCENTTGDAYIGTHLFLTTDNNKLLNIHLGAAYAVESIVDDLETGQTITVHGFRTEQMKSDNYVAKNITVNAHIYQLRDEGLRPFWARDQNLRRNNRFSRCGQRW